MFDYISVDLEKSRTTILDFDVVVSGKTFNIELCKSVMFESHYNRDVETDNYQNNTWIEYYFTVWLKLSTHNDAMRYCAKITVNNPSPISHISDVTRLCRLYAN